MTAQRPAPVGYDDTPYIPDTPFRVHDIARPAPRVITPGSASTEGAAGRAPSDAVVLFDGRDLSGWVGKDGQPAGWKVESGYTEVTAKAGNIQTREHFGDCQLHVEWATPAEVKGDSQGRGNSGVFLMGRYEIQVLDCFENPTYADGTAGAIYGQYPPLVNACRRPGEWQTYDIVWLAPRFEGDSVVTPAYATIFLNGVLVQYHRELIGGTSHRRLAPYAAHPPTGPLELQDHGNPVRYRNIWYRPIDPRGDLAR
jgi:hypothetical protein